MTIDDYLDATGMNRSELARLVGMPQRTLHAIADKGGSCRVEQAELLIDGMRDNPALNARGTPRLDNHITLGDLAAGARKYLTRKR